MPAGPRRWRHVPSGKTSPRRSRWLAPVTWRELRALPTYAEFTARYPWSTDPERCGAVTSEPDWLEGVRRLRAYHTRLARIRRKRVLRAGENPCLDLVLDLAGAPPDRPLTGPAWPMSPGLANVLDLPARRRELVSLFSWAIPADGALAVVSRYAPIVECGAGMGYWAAALRARGVDVAAYDRAPPAATQRANSYHSSGRGPWTQVRAASAVAAVAAHPDRALLLCWPPYDDDSASYAALRALRGDIFLYIGEGQGGPTGSVRFHRELELNWSPVEQVEIPRWPRLHDRLIVYQRNALRRRQIQRDRCPECHRFVPTGSAGRCDRCFASRPPALAVRVAGQRIEYPSEIVAAMPAALRLALEQSPSCITVSGRPPRVDLKSQRACGHVEFDPVAAAPITARFAAGSSGSTPEPLASRTFQRG